jgi:hypothetical protein
MDIDFAFSAILLPVVMSTRLSGILGVLLALAALAGCDPQRIAELEEGVSTEADVRARFGPPDKVWDGPGGERVFEYDRQPSGHKNYMISIGADGRMTALRQVLDPAYFARVQPGMSAEDVRRLLGQPMKQTPFPLKNEVAWDWRFMQPPRTSMVFTVWFGPDGTVLRTGSAPDPEAPENRG